MDEAGQGNGDGSIERRRAPRRKVLKRAQIVTLDKMSTIDCIVRNVSSTGARIAAPSLRDIPDRFYLRTPGQHLVPCRVVRKDLTSVVIIFEADRDHPAIEPRQDVSGEAAPG
jgi:hypothetical protein